MNRGLNVLRTEFLQVQNQLEWKINESSQIGQWKIAHLINQGQTTNNFYLLSTQLRFLLGPA